MTTTVEYVTVEGIEIGSVGMAWNGVGGPYYLTAEHYADMVAAQADPLIRAARVKLGHIDPRFNGALTSHDPGNLDAEPAFGTWANLRTKNAGTTFVGDMTEVPADLAASLPSTFPNRSMEWVWDYTTEGGKHYSAVLTDVALLGTRMQAVSDLADIVRANLPAQVATPILADLTAAAAAREETSLPALPAASVSVDRVCDQFIEWAESDPVAGVETYWWWPRDIRLDPDEVIASGDGKTWRVPFTTDGAANATFAAPVEVYDTYVDLVAPSAAASAAQARHGQRVVARDLPCPENKKKPSTAASRPDISNERTPMDESVRKALAAANGLDPDTATEEQVNDAVLAAAAVSPVEDEAEKVEEAEPVVEDDRELVPAASLTTTVDRAQFAEMQRQIDIAAKERRAAQVLSLDALADSAIKDGRIAQSVREDWRAAIDPGDNPDAAALARASAELAALKSLTPGRIPVLASAAAPAAGATAASDALYEASRKRMGAINKES